MDQASACVGGARKGGDNSPLRKWGEKRWSLSELLDPQTLGAPRHRMGERFKQWGIIPHTTSRRVAQRIADSEQEMWVAHDPLWNLPKSSVSRGGILPPLPHFIDDSASFHTMS